MRLNSRRHTPWQLVRICLLVTSSLAHGQTNTLQKRDNQGDVVGLTRSNPVQAAQLVLQFPGLANNATAIADNSLAIVQNADSDTAQLPWNSNVPFVATPSTNVSADGGWQSIPQLDGFDMNRTWEIQPGVIMPFYIKSGLNPAAVKRAILSWPGKPRDTWKYANLYRNALNVVEANQSSGVDNNTILIVAPIWLNELDQQAGSVQEGEIYFHGSNWQAGGSSIGPGMNHTISTYSVMDNFTDMLFDRSLYPNLNQVVVAGHSMGGQAAHRYAILKKQKAYDDNLSYWVGNPGSWTFLSPDRPYHNDSCIETYDTWHYGIGGNTSKITRYARHDVVVSKDAIVRRYLSRKVHMALGLLDYGPGDTHCQARYQGGSHLDRGSNMVLHLAKVNNGSFPLAQTVDFVANTSHQDYAMISTNMSLQWLFLNDYNKRYPNIAASNPGDNVKHHIKNATKSRKKHKDPTHGDVVLAYSMFGGSLFSLLAFFILLPLIFTPNWVEHQDYYSKDSHGIYSIPLLDPNNMLPRRESIPMYRASLAPTYVSSASRAGSPLFF